MKILDHRFVDKIPNQLEEGILYVSIPYETVIHKCCCGCGNEVVTPLSPTDWSLTFDGATITLDPSIGSWSLECNSHYFIRKNKVVWSISYTEIEIDEVRKTDVKDKYFYYKEEKQVKKKVVLENQQERKSFWNRFTLSFFKKRKS